MKLRSRPRCVHCQDTQRVSSRQHAARAGGQANRSRSLTGAKRRAENIPRAYFRSARARAENAGRGGAENAFGQASEDVRYSREPRVNAE